MLFPSVGCYMLINTEAIICFILFSHKFYDRSYGSYMIYSSNFDLRIGFKVYNSYALLPLIKYIIFIWVALTWFHLPAQAPIVS